MLTTSLEREDDDLLLRRPAPPSLPLALAPAPASSRDSVSGVVNVFTCSPVITLMDTTDPSLLPAKNTSSWPGRALASDRMHGWHNTAVGK